jgi:hypothetical protein
VLAFVAAGEFVQRVMISSTMTPSASVAMVG